MQYISLYKKFFTTSDNANQSYQSLFNCPSAVHLNIKNHDYEMFFVVNNEMVNLIENIYNLNSKIIQLTKANREIPSLLNDWLVKHTFIEEIVMTNEIEGVVSTRKEILELMKINKPKKYKRLFGLVNKYMEIVNHSFEPLCKSQDIRDLYNKAMLMDIEKENKRNVPDGVCFRKEMVEVQSGGNAIHKGVYPEEKIIETMDQALDILNNQDLPLLIRVAVYHYLFGYIHPFYDGNGRMSRFITSAYLNTKLDTLCALQLSVACMHHQKIYHESFKITNDIRNKADLTYFIISFLEILESGLINLEKTIKDSYMIYHSYHYAIENRKEIINKENEILNLLLQNHLFDIQGCSFEELMKLCECSKMTLNKRLKGLIEQNYVLIDKTNKSYLYSINLDKLIPNN